MKRVLVINSLVGIGRAGMYPQIAALTRAGVQACPVPSVVLSTHTGGFGTPARADMTGELCASLEHFRSLDLRFDMTVSGYLASPEQAEAIARFISEGRGGTYICDPVLADGGRLYRGIEPPLVEAMKRLSALADAVTPNVTEALILTGRDHAAPPSAGELREAAAALSRGRAAVVTGADEGDEVCCLAAEDSDVSEVRRARAPGSFPGTGDLFCGALAAAVLEEEPWTSCVGRAMDVAARAVRASLEAGTEARFGTELEKTL